MHYYRFHRSHRQTLILIDSCCFIKTAASRHQKLNISVMLPAGLTSHFFYSSILNRFPSLTLRLPPAQEKKRKHCLFDETINVKKSLISLCGGRLKMIYRNKNTKLKLARKF